MFEASMEIGSDAESIENAVLSDHSEEDFFILDDSDVVASVEPIDQDLIDGDENPTPQAYSETSTRSKDEDPVDVKRPKIESSSSKLDASSEDDSQMCPICFEVWTSSGEHRLVSLRCGHLFGRRCITKWLLGQGSRCPQCNARARKSEIRPIFARCLKVLDTTERDRALAELELQSQLRKKAELECAQMRLKYQMVVNESESLRKELQNAQSILKETRLPGERNAGALKPMRSSTFKLCTKLDLKSCRVMDHNDNLGIMVLSQTAQRSLFGGCGLRKVSIPDMTVCEYIYVHQKAIKDISFHAYNGLILTASLDKTVKMTNSLNNGLIQTYNFDCEAWSCKWDEDDPCYFSVGMRSGAVYLCDIRMTDRHVDQLTSSDPTPVVSIQYVKRHPSLMHSGLVVGRLCSCSYYEKRNASTYDMHQLPLEGKFSSLSYEPTTAHLLVSCRPSPKYPRITHTLCYLAYEEESFRCNLVNSISAGASLAQLSRSKLICHPQDDSSVLVCAGDDEEKATLIWDGSTGQRLESLKTDSDVLDITSFKRNQKSLLATITDQNLRIYEWSNV